MNVFISLNLADGGIVAIRPERIVAIESNEPGVDTIRLEGISKAYDIVSGQITLNKLAEHCTHAGVRVA